MKNDGGINYLFILLRSEHPGVIVKY